MSKAAIAGMLVDRLGLKRPEAQQAVDIMLEGIQSIMISRGRATFVGFGSFHLAERRGRRPAGADSVLVSTDVVFSVGEGLANAVEAKHPSRYVKVQKPRSPRRG